MITRSLHIMLFIIENNLVLNLEFSSCFDFVMKYPVKHHSNQCNFISSLELRTIQH